MTKMSVTASETRQSISVPLDDGWPRCARHDGIAVLVMTKMSVTASEAWQSISVPLDNGWPRCARHDGIAVLVMTVSLRGP